MEEDGSYYIMSCEKCGAEIRKHKSYGTRYGEAYHFNPELKCSNCGFSVKVVYGSSFTSSSPSKTSGLHKNDDQIPCPKCNSTQIIAENKEYLADKTIAGVVLTGGIKVAKFMNEKEINTEEGTEEGPEFIKNRIDVKVETIIAANTLLNELTKEKIIDENAKIMIVTNFGIVEGTLKQEVDANDVAQQISLGSAKIRNNHLSKLEKEVASPIITNNNYFVTILNAKVIPFSNPSKIVTFTVLNLFSDKIVGFTFGEYQ
jgi:hypothetical protein